MSAPERKAGRRAGRAVAVPLLLTAAVALLALGHATRGKPDEGAGAQASAQSWLGVIDAGGALIDASPDEAAGETWSLGDDRVLRYTDAGGWEAAPVPLDAGGKPFEHLAGAGSPQQGRATRGGAVALLANDALIVRDPGGRFHAAPAPDQPGPGDVLPSTTTPPTTSAPGSTSVPGSTTAPGSTSVPGSTTAPGSTTTPPDTATPPLHDGESLYEKGSPLLAPLERDGHAGAFVVPTAGDDGARDAVLRFDGSAWSREPICLGTAPACDAPGPGFAVLAIDAAGAGHAWLLATGTTADAGVVLLHREAADGDDPVWRPVDLAGSPFAERQPNVGGATTVRIAPRGLGQPLVATARGVWADATIAVGAGHAVDATLFYDEDVHAVRATWCDATGDAATLCTKPLGSDLPHGDARSFAWDDGTTYGARLITGLDQGAMLRLSGDAFTRVPTAGRGVGTEGGAAFAAPDDGWLGGDSGPVRYGRAPEAARLRSWPVPFRHPLTAIAAEPGRPIGAIDAQALAVGDQGEVARYLPGQGWSPESLLGPTGARAKPRLRGVTWPAPDRAYAVGDNAEMWLWRKATGLWEPDPAKPPNLALANFTGIAFDPGNPDRGYAVGKQGVLLRFDRQWTQEPLPGGLGDANFTSIAFAGHQAIVTYKTPVGDNGQGYRGGVLVNDGSGWREDTSLAAVLPTAGQLAVGSGVPGQASVPERVAGLPDGSAVVATMDGHIATRDGGAGPWRAADLQPAGYPVALGAFHEDGAVRAVISVDPAFRGITQSGIDSTTINQPAPPGQAPVLTDPYPIPAGGYVLRQTAHGWHDEQHAYASRSIPAGSTDFDLPEQPDPVLAFLTDPFGRAGWGVGGDVDVQTANVVRYPDDGQAAPGATTAPVTTDPDMATFAVGGGATCLSGCADLEPVGAGPWRWLPAAVARAAQIDGVRAFLHTGPGTAGPGATDDFPHEQAAAARRLTGAAGSLPVFTAPGGTDRDESGSLGTFLRAFGSANAPLGGAAAPGITPIDAARDGHAYYAFDATGTGGNVRVLVLDTSAGELGDAQRCWVASQLAGAATQTTPAIVVGNSAIADLGDADAAAQVLVSGTATGCDDLPGAPAGASAYFFDDPGVNRRVTIASGADAIPGFGTGSLGYIDPPLRFVTNKPPNSGFLLAEVDVVHRDELSNRAPVTARLIPNIAELAVDATDGTLLRRSQIALFDGLARRPRAGLGCKDAPSCLIVPDPYVSIPFDCVGEGCDKAIAPEYRFTSSDPSVAGFVARDPASTNPRRPLLDAAGKPVADANAASGLLCAYNPGTTTITLTAGGLSYSQRVTVQEGSVRRPCGTVPANRAQPTPKASDTPATVGPIDQPAIDATPAGGGGLLPPPPAPAAHAPAKPHAKPPKAPVVEPSVPFLPVASGLTQVVAAPPPPGPTAARPAPPSGTASSQVYQSAVAPERQREEEHAVDTVSNMVRYEPGLPLIVSRGGAVLMLVLAGLLLTDLRPRPRRALAFITTNDDRRGLDPDRDRDPRTPR
jgi:hypothetical protein